MRIFVVFVGFVMLGILPAQAEKVIDLTKPGQDHGISINKEIDKLFSMLAGAIDEKQARAVENQIWQSWMAMPEKSIRKLVKEAMEARRWYDFAKARKLLDKVVEQAPEYAEGWNQRAFILFLQEKYDESLSDLEKAITLEPRHFGALAGQARILMRQGRFATAQALLKKAVKIHPFLRERGLIVEPKKQDL